MTNLSRLMFATMVLLCVVCSAAWAQTGNHPLGPPWQSADIGDVGLPGSAQQGPDADLFINGAGSDIWGTADSFFFVYQPIEDGEIRSNPPEQDATDPHAKIGLMFRLTLDPDSPHVVLDKQPDGSLEFMTRSIKGGETTFIAGTAPGSGAWGSLTRANGIVTATVCSATGCQTLGQAPFPDGPAYVGAVVTSHDPSVLNHGIFPADTPAVFTVPPPWSHSDIGTVGLTGSAYFQDSLFTVSGAGADIWGTADAYQAVETNLQADGVVTARVTSETAANTFAKAGVIANSNDAAGPTVILDIRPNGLIEFMARPSQGASMAFVAGSSASFPVWLKLQRAGDTFSGYVSGDGVSWQLIGATDVSMPTNIRAGFAVTSHDSNALNTSTFDQVTAASAGPLDTDIGDVGASGSAEVTTANTDLTGSGADIWGTADAFNYFYTSLINDGGMFARVDTLDDTNAFAKAGIMIRASTDPSAAHVILDVKPDGEIEFMTRASTGAETTFLAGSARAFPVFIRLERVGSTVNAWVVDGTQLTPIGSAQTDLPADALIGLAVTSHVKGTLANAAFDDITR